jgi:peptidoglycan/LPS O-acetylase OafA/YrhL
VPRVIIIIAILSACSALTNALMAWRYRSDRQNAALRLIGSAVGLLPIVGVVLFKANHWTLSPSIRIRYILLGVALLVGLTLLLPESIQRARQRHQQPAKATVRVSGPDTWVN